MLFLTTTTVINCIINFFFNVIKVQICTKTNLYQGSLLHENKKKQKKILYKIEKKKYEKNLQTEGKG